MITLAQIRLMSPRADPVWSKALVAGWPELVRLADLTTPARQRHFLAQVAEESGGYRRFEENLRYTAKRLTEVWPNRFPTLAAAKPFAGNPEALADKVYGGRKDLGNMQPGDGWRYRGRGPIQATGRRWAERLSARLGLDLVERPDLLLDPTTGWRSAAVIWSASGANAFVDRDDFVGETRRINGGLTGLDGRRRYLAQAQTILA